MYAKQRAVVLMFLHFSLTGSLTTTQQKWSRTFYILLFLWSEYKRLKVAPSATRMALNVISDMMLRDDVAEDGRVECKQ